MKKLSVLCAFCFVLSTLAYTSDDLTNANSLADQGIVTKQTVAAKYGLDNKILRQEVIGMALKVKGITLPDNYNCKKYFADATKNDWVCRAVELAADNGIITKNNRYANPGKYVTRSEALAMIMKAGGFTNKLSQEQLESLESWRMHFDTDISWHQDIILQAFFYDLIDTKKYISDSGFTGSEGATGNSTTLEVKFSPNRLATRAEVFGFTKNILSSQNTTTVKLIYIGENAKGGDSAYGICENSMILITENTKIIKTPAILKSTLETLLDEKNNPEYMEFGPWNLAGMYDLELQSVGIVNNIASIYLEHSEQTLTHDTQDDLLAHVNSQSGGMQFSKENLLCGIGAQITTLAKQFSTVQKVRVYINNILISEM